MARAPPPPPLPLLAALLAALAARAAAAAPLPVAVAVDWAAGPTRSGVTTAATVEVDIMPQLARSSGDPGFPGYFEALSNLNAAHVRFAPWYGYPRAAVLELEPAECGGKGSSFNSSVLDEALADFMLAVCGPRAAAGECASGHSVVPQLSTMPAWLYVSDGKNRTPPLDPWTYPFDDMAGYVVRNQPLADATCGAMGRYAARYVAHYTAGGHTDECGVFHPSGLFYNWPHLSVLNENEYNTPPGDGVVYTLCWDAWKREIAKVNPNLQLVGPEIAMGGGASVGGGEWRYTAYFLNGSNHADGVPPPFISSHLAFSGGDGSFGSFFSTTDDWITNFASPLDALRSQIAPSTRLIMNEFIPFMNSWCTIPPDAPAGENCDWQSNSSHAVLMNRATLGWSASAASFAYAFGRLSELDFFIVGQDQLIGGPWPNNEPAVASLDWDTGLPNAKYYAINMLATAFGTAPRNLFNTSVSSAATPVAPGTTAPGNCGFTWWDEDCSGKRNAQGAWNTTADGIADLASCAARCAWANCTSCNYVSFSLQNEDCSWYASCDFANLAPLPIYESEAVSPGRVPPTTSELLYATAAEVPGGGGGGPARRLLLLVSKTADVLAVSLVGGFPAGATAIVLEGAGQEPGFNPPQPRAPDASGALQLGSFAVAIVTLA